MNSIKLLCAFLFLSFANDIYGVDEGQVKELLAHRGWSFTENKGQLANEFNYQLKNVKYYGYKGGVHIYCLPDKISFAFTQIERDQDISESTGRLSLRRLRQKELMKKLKSKITVNRIDLVLVNSNPSAKITATDQQEYFENYYTSHNADRGITNVRTYKTVLYKSIYPHIDMILKVEGQGMEYLFEVHQGGKLSDIKLKWNGVNKIESIENGGIQLANSIGKIRESVPTCFVDGKIIRSSLVKDGTSFGFKTEKYDKKKTLLVDPSLAWATFYGGTAENDGFGICADDSENVYITGQTHSSTGIATSGAYISSYNGNDNVFVAKFSKSGKLLWGTYFGGSYGSEGNSIATDHFGKLYLSGVTFSESGIATSGAYQTSYKGNGAGDAYLAKFTNSGQLQWSTYYGISCTGWEVKTDYLGDIYISGVTSSDSGIATTGAYQTTFGGGIVLGDAYLAKFNSSGNLQWATYYGGNGHDEPWGLAIDALGKVYITGQTTSFTGIATPGAYQSVYGGGGDIGDAFLAKFDGAGKLLWGTYFGGSNDDESWGVSTDILGNVFITGPTGSNNGIATAGSFQTSLPATWNAFLAKFSTSGSLVWATYYGGNKVEAGQGVCTDYLGNIYLTGLTTSTKGLTTSGAYQTFYGGGYFNGDAFLAKFSNSGILLYSTYYGGSGDDEGNAICSDASGNVYITGRTFSDSNIATPNSYQTSNLGGGDFGNSFLAKFHLQFLNDAGISGFTSPIDSFCPGEQRVSVILKNYGPNQLDSVRINWNVNGKPQKHFFWLGTLLPDSNKEITIGKFDFSPGIDTIVAWTSNPNGEKDSVPENDTTRFLYKISLPDANWTMKSIDSWTKIFNVQNKAFSSSSYIWDFGDGKTGIGNPVTNTYDKNGEYKVGLTICSKQYDSIIFVAGEFELAIFPNPFSIQTDIRYFLPNPAHIKIAIMDMLGRDITTLLNTNLETGEYNTIFNAQTYKTRPGMYLVVFMMDDKVITRKIVQMDSLFY